MTRPRPISTLREVRTELEAVLAGGAGPDLLERILLVVHRLGWPDTDEGLILSLGGMRAALVKEQGTADEPGGDVARICQRLLDRLGGARSDELAWEAYWLAVEAEKKARGAISIDASLWREAEKASRADDAAHWLARLRTAIDEHDRCRKAAEAARLEHDRVAAAARAAEEATREQTKTKKKGKAKR